MHCHECGHKLPEDALFCNECGCAVNDDTKSSKTSVKLNKHEEYAGFWPRVGAFFIDLAVIYVAVDLLIWIGYENPTKISADTEALLTLGAIILYHAVYVALHSTTFGKSRFGMRVINENGAEHITNMQGFGRAFAYLISSIFLGIGFIMVGFNKQKRGLHDYIAKTVVIRDKRKDTGLAVILTILAILYVTFSENDFQGFFGANSASPTNNVVSSETHESCDEQATIQKVKRGTHLVGIFDRRGDFIAYGSGFALADSKEKGLILTNYHVIEDAAKIKVWVGYEGKEWMDAKIFAAHPNEDMALIQVDYKFPYELTLSNSDVLQDAETLYAIGWPNDPTGDATITKGIVSRVIKEEDFELIQTDASINPGNSGGPLINKCGVVGMNVAKLTWADDFTPAEGTSYALSAKFIKKTIYEK